jgi:hypothetical protein
MGEIVDIPSPRVMSRLTKWHRELLKFDVPTLRRMWDEVSDDDSFYDGPEGSFDCADIHMVLNLKGDGAYCAV